MVIKYSGFSLLEVIIAIGLLVMTIGGILSLNILVLKINVENEIRAAAYALADETANYLKVSKKNGRLDIIDNTKYFFGCGSNLEQNECEIIQVISPNDPLFVVLGRNKLKYFRTFSLVNVNDSPVLTIEVRWGEASRQFITTVHQI